MSTAYIKKLELQGFKSFSERTRILFHPGITAIIGPNGTGKSNIVDALLWVLGGQRPRAVRGEKIDDIIFNGNTKRPPMGMADVTLNLANEPEDLIINHRAHRSGEGEYRLDGKAVRLKDIQDELWKRAIGDKEYFVIEQGSIGQFVTSKPQEKRFLLEAAAGTAFYKDKRRQAEHKLEDSELNLTRLEDIIAEVAHSRNSLQRQAQAAVRYRKLRERIRELTGFHFRRKLIQIEKRQAEVAEEFARFQAREKESAGLAAAADKDVQLKRRDLWDLEKTLKEEREVLFNHKAAIARMESERDREAKRIEFFEEKKKRSLGDLEELRREMADLEREAAEAEAGLKDLARELSLRQQEAAAAEQEALAVRNGQAGLTQSFEDLRRDYVQRVAAATEVKNEQARLDKEAELLARQDEKLSERLSAERARLEESLEQLRLVEETRERFETERSAAESWREEHRARLESRSRALAELQAEASVLKDRRDGAAIHLETLKKMIETERRGVSGDEIPGAMGLLADFIEADSETTPLLDILWKDESRARLVQAREFLEVLQHNRVQGQFLLLPPSQLAEAVPPAAADPSALGLIKERLRTDVRLGSSLSRLQDAVITADLRTAVDLWLRYPSCNFITLAGDLLLASGLLRPADRAEGFFSLSQEMKKLEQELVHLDSELEPLSARLEEGTREKQSLEKELVNLSGRLAELEAQVRDEDQKRMLAQAERDKEEGDIGLLEKERRVLGTEIEALGPRLEELRTRSLGAQSAVEAHQEKLDAAESDQADAARRLAEAEQRSFEVKAATEVLREKISGLKRQAEGLRQRRETASLKASGLEEEIRSGDEEEARLKLQLRDLGVQADSLEAQRLEKEAEVSQSEARHVQFEKDLEELEANLKARREDQERVKEERVRWEVARAETERDLVNLEEVCWQELRKSPREIRAEIAAETVGGDEVESELEQAKEDLQRYKAVNLMAEEEYLAQKERHEFLVKQRDDLRQSIASTKEAIQKIDEESKSMFLTALAEVNRNFQQVFAILFNGGTAEVKLTEPETPLESGVEIVAQPPGKKVQSMTLLSGGEKSLTSLAFLFALFRYKPAPFCILDEVDAALDDVNLSRFLELMKKIKTETQFIIVTHNYKTMEVADFIYGTTMSEPNVTSIYSMKLEKKEASPSEA
jgi:chromosome segregation protein